jgi:hypothetical protein
MKKGHMVVLITYAAVLLCFQGRFLRLAGEPLMFWGSVGTAVIAVPALLGLYSGAADLLAYRKIRRTGIRVKAQIIDYHIEDSRLKTYYPVIRFRDAAGITCTYRSEAGMILVPKKYRRGGTVSVVYPPDKPEAFVIVPAYCYYAWIRVILFAAIAVPAAAASVGLILSP